ncbi:hypothetical protein HRED_08935 [Candidatus Haloredivivus sp. G17]|nr:hypothetical protein HRED_08935 [Candidatus Haloredivivus sp. G17]
MPNGIEDEIENEGGDHREISVAEFFSSISGLSRLL